MGGGDLNLKKSWHPSTMRNMEKVWKAEQKHDMEKKRIAELQREIQQEKAKEDMKKFAEDQGVLEKKSEVKLDWMYKGPGTNINHEEYLLGKAIDKNFEQLQRSHQNVSISVPGRSDTCLPGSIFAGSGEQVDIIRKLQEDPLLAIRKKEIESRSQILKNPVKLKQLKEMIKKQKSSKHSKHKKGKKKKKKSKKRSKRSSSSENSDDSNLDAQLLAKYQQLKEKLACNALSMLHEKESDFENKNKHRKRSHSSDSQSSSSDEIGTTHERKTTSSYGLQLPQGAELKKPVPQLKVTSEEFQKNCDKGNTTHQYRQPKKQKLTEEEKEHRRQEMLADGASRERERQCNVTRYREADKQEQAQGRRKFSDNFLREQISKVTAHGSVASRIKSNINNIQRSGGSMERNFARR